MAPSGQRKKAKAKGDVRRQLNVPLSSYPSIPLTDETAQTLVAAGVDDFSGNELEAQSVLALAGVGARGGQESVALPCFAKEFDPASQLCVGCLFLPKCWHSDPGYMHRLRRGEVEPPPGVPDKAVDARKAMPQTAVIRRPPPSVGE